MSVTLLFVASTLGYSLAEIDNQLCAQLTVVIVTSPPASAPDIGLFTSTYNYLQTMPCAQNAQFLVGLHVNTDRKEERVWQYERNMREWHTNNKNAIFVVANMRSVEVSFSRLLSLVETKYYLFWEHDWRFCRDVSLPAILRQMEMHRPLINYVRFNKARTVVNHNGLYDAVLEVCRDCDLVPLLFTPSWSNNPHIARYSFFIDHCRPLLQKDTDAQVAYGFFEWALTQAIAHSMWKIGTQNTTALWGTYLYGHLNDPQLIYHLDGANSHDISNITGFSQHCPIE